MNKELAITSCAVVDALDTETARNKCAFERYALRYAGEILAELAHTTDPHRGGVWWKELYTLAGDVVEENNEF